MRVSEYELVATDDRRLLVEEVNTRIADGMQPTGSPVIVFSLDGDFVMAQAMVRAEEQHEELQRLRGIEARAKMMRGELDAQRGVISDADLVEYTKQHLDQVLGVEVKT